MLGNFSKLDKNANSLLCIFSVPVSAMNISDRSIKLASSIIGNDVLRFSFCEFIGLLPGYQEFNFKLDQIPNGMHFISVRTP